MLSLSRGYLISVPSECTFPVLTDWQLLDITICDRPSRFHGHVFTSLCLKSPQVWENITWNMVKKWTRNLSSQVVMWLKFCHYERQIYNVMCWFLSLQTARFIVERIQYSSFNTNCEADLFEGICHIVGSALLSVTGSLETEGAIASSALVRRNSCCKSHE